MGGFGSWALDSFRPGERVTLDRGLVNQVVAPLVEFDSFHTIPQMSEPLWFIQG